MIDADVEQLTPLLSEITRHIPSVDDSSLIEHLRGGVELIEILRLRYGGGIIVTINSLAERERYHRYAKTFTAILKYSLLAVQRFCQGDAQVRIILLLGAISEFLGASNVFLGTHEVIPGTPLQTVGHH